MKKKKPLLIFKGKGHTKENIELKARKDAYFQVSQFWEALIFKYALIFEKIRYLIGLAKFDKSRIFLDVLSIAGL